MKKYFILFIVFINNVFASGHRFPIARHENTIIRSGVDFSMLLMFALVSIYLLTNKKISLYYSGPIILILGYLATFWYEIARYFSLI
jgi:hypothetical protein